MYKWRLGVYWPDILLLPLPSLLPARGRVPVHFDLSWSSSHKTEGAAAMVKSAAPQLSVELQELGRGSLADGHWQWSAFKYSRRILVTALLDMILASVLTVFLVFDLTCKYMEHFRWIYSLYALIFLLFRIIGLAIMLKDTIPLIHDINAGPIKIWFILGTTVELVLIAGSAVG
jgi:hypothetical protein